MNGPTFSVDLLQVFPFMESLGFVLLIAFVIWRYSVASAGRSVKTSLARVLQAIGVILIVAVLVRSEQVRGRLTSAESMAQIHRVIMAAESSPIDRVHLLAVVLASESSALPRVVLEAIVPVEPTNARAVAAFPELGMTAEIVGDLAADRVRVQVTTKLKSPGSYEQHSQFGFDSIPLSVGDERPFQCDGVRRELRGPYRLGASPDGWVLLLRRELRSGDVVEARAAEESIAGIEQAIAGLSRSYSSKQLVEHPSSAIARLRTELDLRGIGPLFLGLLLLFVSMRPSVALGLSTLCVVLAVAIDARRDFSERVEQLASTSPLERRIAVTALGNAVTHAQPAAELLIERYRTEPDAAVRAEIVRAIADPREFVGALPECGPFFESARADRSPEVELAVQRLSGLRQPR